MSIEVNENRKTVPRSILVFGAAAHIGGPLVRYLRREAPEIKLRLVSSNPDRCESLRLEYPGAEVVSANYNDLPSLESAVQGMEGIFVLTPGGTDERPAMTNLVTAIKKAGCVVHILRGVGMQPESNLRRIPEALRTPPALGLPVQHPIVKQIFDESGLPVTYLNFGATFMDNFRFMTGALRRERKLVWHNRLIPFIDPRDIGEVAGRLFLSNNHRHIGQFHTLNNGHDLMRFSDVADLMTEVFGEKITHDGSKDGFFQEYEELGDLRNILWDFFEYERENEVVWARNDFVERTLGRKPITMREWLREHARELLGTDKPATSDRPAGWVAGAQTDATQSASAVDGIWDCVVSTPVGKESNELTLRSAADGTLTGEMKSVKSGEVLPLLDGKVSGDVLTWSMRLSKPFKMTLKVEVQVNGPDLKGQASAGMLGKSPITGVKRA